jgi:hypothetical protein
MSPSQGDLYHRGQTNLVKSRMLSVLFISASAAGSLVNTHIDRTYNVHDNLIIVAVKAEIQNSGSAPVSTYQYRLTPRESGHAGIFLASTERKKNRDFTSQLPVRQVGSLYTIELTSPIRPGESQTLYISYTLGNYFLFLKPTIQLNQRIGLFFNTSLYYQGPYDTHRSSLTIEGISKSVILRKTEVAGLRLLSNTISITDLTDPSNDDFEVEFSTSKALPLINSVHSRTTISHWGQSKQQLFYDITNAGPKFVGEFNRIDFTSNTPCYLQTVTLRPPSGASHFWARDEGGQLQREIPYRSSGELEVPLRGPMLSSWKATFTVGWTVKTAAFVSGNFRFQSELLVGSLAAPITKVTAEIVLPEGARIKSTNLPIPANITQYNEIHSLDWNGRVVVHIETEAVTSKDVIPLTIEYELPPLANFEKIGLLIGAFALVFVAITIGRRIDLGI